RTEIRHLGVDWIPEGFKEVIEGGEGELERIGEGPREVEEGAGVDYRVIDYARDLMRGRFNDETAEVASETVAADRVNRKYRESVVEAAIGAYGLHLQEFPEDWMVVREMAVALLEGRRVADAGKLMYEAYVQDPELGIMPVNGLILGESKELMMKLVVRAVRAAHREPSAQGWLLVAVLMQAQGRVELAGEMLDRADELGLDGKISWGLHEALP
ncbi:MAG: hypothetical protein JKY43_07950, partial [Phycisphaerales bacterium]|nr:hypothetical protein [Phycisphaerales bacterium]